MKLRLISQIAFAVIAAALSGDYALGQLIRKPDSVNVSVERQARGQLAVTVSNSRSEELLAFTTEGNGKLVRTGNRINLRSHFDSVAGHRVAPLRKGGAATVEIGSPDIEIEEIYVCGLIYPERLPTTMDACTMATIEYWVYALELARASSARIGALRASGAGKADVIRALESIRDTPIEINPSMHRVRARERVLGLQMATLRSAANENREPGSVVAAVEYFALQTRTDLEGRLRPIVVGSQWEERVSRPERFWLP